MKKILLSTLLLSLFPTIASAQTAYLGKDGFFNIQGLEPNSYYEVNLGGMPIIRAGNSNSCGILRVATNQQVKVSEKIEIKDEKANKIYGFINDNLPTKDIRCNGEIKPEREIWKDDNGTVWISGLSPSSAQTIRLLTSRPTRKIRANICGFISLRIGEPKPRAIIFQDKAFSINGVEYKGGIVCRKGKLYVSYPPEPPLTPIPLAQWEQEEENQNTFSPGVISAVISGGSTTWNGGGNTDTNNGGNNTTTNNGGNNTSTNKPMPPANTKYCKVGVQLVVVGLTPGKTAYTTGVEGRNFRQAVVDSSGWVQFDAINFDAEWEGESIPTQIGYIQDDGDLGTPLAGAYNTFPISVVQPCQ